MESSPEPTPSVSFDTHFRNVPGLQQVDFDCVKFGNLLMEVGYPEDKLNDVLVYVRPDYSLAYSRAERIRTYLRNPFEYDDEAGSCEEGGSLDGTRINIVYGTDDEVNYLLRYEAKQAVDMLAEQDQDSNKDKETERARTWRAIGQVVVMMTATVIEYALRKPDIGATITLGVFGWMGYGLYNDHKIDKQSEEKEEAQTDKVANSIKLKQKYNHILEIKTA